MTTVEHSIPIPVLYEDMLTLYTLSGTGSTPTHIVNYGGVMGEEHIWATEDIPSNPRFVHRAASNKHLLTYRRLRQLTRHDILEGVSESTARPMNCAYPVSLTTASR